MKRLLLMCSLVLLSANGFAGMVAKSHPLHELEAKAENTTIDIDSMKLYAITDKDSLEDCFFKLRVIKNFMPNGNDLYAKRTAFFTENAEKAYKLYPDSPVIVAIYARLTMFFDDEKLIAFLLPYVKGNKDVPEISRTISTVFNSWLISEKCNKNNAFMNAMRKDFSRLLGDGTDKVLLERIASLEKFWLSFIPLECANDEGEKKRIIAANEFLTDEKKKEALALWMVFCQGLAEKQAIRDIRYIERRHEKTAVPAGTKVSPRDRNGWTPLMVAARTNDPQKIMSLLKSGTDVNEKTEEGKTPLMFAAETNSNPEVIVMLIKACANVKAKTERGDTALSLAASRNPNPKVIEELIKAGADINTKCAGWSALESAACVNRNPEVIETLIKAGGDVNAKDANNRTLLMHACKSNPNPKVIELLIKVGNDVNARDDDGWTPLINAAFVGDPEIIAALVKAGADVNAKDKHGVSVLDYGRKNPNSQMVTELIKAGAK
jgi:ankyrin repeat protein